MVDLVIPKSFIQNLDVIVRHQNVQLITEICKWKNWDSQELIDEFAPLLKKQPKNGIYKTSIDCLEDSNKKVDKNIEIRVRNRWNFNDQDYYLELPHNNVYNLEGQYVGRKVEDSINFNIPPL